MNNLQTKPSGKGRQYVRNPGFLGMEGIEHK